MFPPFLLAALLAAIPSGAWYASGSESSYLMHYLFAAMLAAVPSVLWFYFWWRKDNQKEPAHVLVQAVFLGMLAALVLLPLRYYLPSMPMFAILVLTAVLEEFLKSICVVIVTEKNFRLFDQVIDGIIYAVAVALGFAFVENIVYLSELLNSNLDSFHFWTIYFLRSLTTTFAHTVFTGIFGFAYANAYLLPDDFIPEVFHRKPFACSLKKVPDYRYHLHAVWDILTLHTIFKHVLGNIPSTYKHTPNHLILEGIISAMYLHFLFNICAMLELGGSNYSFLLPGVILLCGWGLISKFALERYRRIVHRKFPPIQILTE